MQLHKAIYYTFFAFALAACGNKPVEPGQSIEQLVSRARLNFASYEISRVYSVCPSKWRRYLIAFKTTVRYDLDLEKTPLSIKKIAGTEKFEVTVPSISMDENVGSKPYEKKVWVLNGNIFVNDKAEAERQKDHIEAYSLYLASQKLGTKELTSLFEDRIRMLVGAISIGMGKEIKQGDIEVVFQKAAPTNYEMPKLSLCKQGDITW